MVSTIKRRRNSTTRTSPVLGLVPFWLGLFLPLALAQADEWRFTDVDRIVAVSDVHGAYDALIETLQEAEVIDESLSWRGGKTHFVITGDLLDRGPDSRKVMDLIIRLEHEAPLAGGRVHQLLGNHEVMNLIGDLRYVADEEYAAFLDFESAEEREYWYQKFRRSRPEDIDERVVRSEFDARAPPGFFGHRRAFRRDGVYGKWLLAKPFMVVINDTVFVHGGIPPFVDNYGLSGVNLRLKNDLIGYVTTSAQLVDAGVLSAVDQFKQVPGMLGRKIEAVEFENGILDKASRAIALSKSPLHGAAGPTWYRGTATCNALIEGDALDSALAKLGANRVVVGHTSTITRTVQQRMNGRVIEIDTGMLHKTYRGSGNALVIDSGQLTVVNQDGGTQLLPTVHPVRVGHESMAVDDEGLARILEHGEIVQSSDEGAAWELIQISAGDVVVSALFVESPEQGAFLPELAAYKLDRWLGLNMVPVTIRREVNGKHGTLQFVPAATLTERERVAAGVASSTPCPLHKQKQAMFVFDALIQNRARSPSSMVYSPEDWNLMLVDHGDSFGVESESLSHVQKLEVGDEWRAVLTELTDDRLNMRLGDVLDADRLQALAHRRDKLLGLQPGTGQ